MLKIVDVHSARTAQGEYIVLQNQGLVTVNLRGWAVCTDAFFEGDPTQMAAEIYLFRTDIVIRPYMRVVLFTGHGDDGWVPTTDGRQAYCAYWNRSERVWAETTTVHVLHVHNTRRVGQAMALAPSPTPA